MNGQWQTVARRIRVPLGFLIAALFLVLARPTRTSVHWSFLFVLPGLLLRGYASGYVKKNAELTVTGPYAYTRNPLYLGSMLIASGFAVASRSPTIALVLAAFFVVVYVPVIRAEEEFLRRTFPEFEAYCRSVPRFLPRLRQGENRSAGGGSSLALYRQHREYNALLGAIGIYAALMLRMHLHT